MQKKITLAGILFLTTAVVMLTAASYQQKDKNNNGNAQKNEAKANKGQPAKSNNGKGQDQKQQGNDNGRQNDQRGNKKNEFEKRNDNNDKKAEKDNNGKYKNDNDKNNKDNRGDNNNGQGGGRKFDDAKLKFNKNTLYGYNWNDDDFKDRKRYRNQEKVTICHKVKNDGEPGVAIRVSESALKAHMNHGDVVGDCAAVNNTNFSDGFLRNRRDYYNNLQQTQEEIYYSRSVLDYALLRLANSRSQLQQMQISNMPAADIQRKQQTVTALEQNTTLLQTLVGVAVEIVANKLM